jgi:hypothetical protein
MAGLLYGLSSPLSFLPRIFRAQLVEMLICSSAVLTYRLASCHENVKYYGNQGHATLKTNFTFKK